LEEETTGVHAKLGLASPFPVVEAVMVALEGGCLSWRG